MLKADQLHGVLDAYDDSGYNYIERRFPEWNENYSLYRDRVIINRITQRQSVNIPVMKYALNTLRKDIDDAPLLHFHNLDNDPQKEVFYNESFKYYMKETKAVIKDIYEKNNAMLFGRTFKKLNICNGKFDFDVIVAEDMRVDRYADKARIDSGRFLIQKHIYKAISELEKMVDYGWDKKEIDSLKEFYATEDGLLKADRNAQEAASKNEKMEELGVVDANNPVLGETIVELTEYYYYDEVNQDDYDGYNEILHCTVRAEDTYIMYTAPLVEILGETDGNYWYDHFPYTTWGIDPDATDFWCDGIADILRMICKIINSWFSQEIERRTLANMGMNYYDSTNKKFVPQTFQPVPWGFYPVPGDPNKIIKTVFPEGQLNTNMDGINFLMQIAEKASAATATNQGATEKSNVTLGEVQLAISNAKDRVKSLAVFYNDSWEEFGLKYTKIIEGSMHLLDDLTITKKGRNTNKKYPKVISPKDWASDAGYSVEIKMVTDKTQDDIESIQKLQASKQFFVGNQKFDNILKRKAAEFAGLNAEEVEEVMTEEQQKLEAAQAGGGQLDPSGQPMGAKPPAQVVNYKDAPPDIRRQMEKADGYTPSHMDNQPQPANPNAPQPPNGQSQLPQGAPQASMMVN